MPPTSAVRWRPSRPAYAAIRIVVCNAPSWPSVRNVGSEHDSLDRHAGEQLDLIERRQRRGVVERVRVIAQARGEHALIGDRRVREHEDDVGVTLRELGERIHAGHAAAGMDQDRDLRLVGDLPDRLGRRVAEAEGLGTGMKLDPACSERQTALGFPDRLLRRIETAVWVQPAAGLLRPAQDPIVRNAIGRRALRIVERERACSRRRPDLVEERRSVRPGRATGRPRRGRDACERRRRPRRLGAARVSRR